MAEFANYADLTIISNTTYNHTNQPGADKSVRLSGVDDYKSEAIGLAKSMKVLPGDTVKMEVFVKYIEPHQQQFYRSK